MKTMSLLDLELIKMNNYLTLENIPEDIEFWNMQYYLDEHTLLHYIEVNDFIDDEDDREIPKSFQLSFKFFGIQYFCDIYYKDLINDNESIYAKGNIILFDSFIVHIEETHWDLIRELCLKLAKRYE